jgi:Flp pilus assembly protein protease CpaA
LSNRLNWSAVFCFTCAFALVFITEEDSSIIQLRLNQSFSSLLFWPLISFFLYYGFYRAKLFYFGDVKYVAVLGLVCLPRAGPLEYLSAQIFSLSFVLIALGVQYLTVTGTANLTVNRTANRSTNLATNLAVNRLGNRRARRLFRSTDDCYNPNSTTGLVEIRAGPYLLMGHLLAILISA